MVLWPPRAAPQAAHTHCVGWTSGTAPSRSTTGPLGLRTFLMEEIFSRSNLLIRLKPAGQSRGGETWPWHGCQGLTLSRQGAEPIPGESGLHGVLICGVRGAFLTRYVLILVPYQILVPELRARLPCKANQHITTVSSGAQGGCTSRVRPCGAPQVPVGLGVLLGARSGPLACQGRWQPRDSMDPANTAPTAAPAPCKQPTRSEAAGLEGGTGGELRAGPGHLPQQVHQVKCFSQLLRVLPQNSPMAGISIRRLGQVPRTPKVGRWHPELPAGPPLPSW